MITCEYLIWTKKDGTQVRVVDMTDEHLWNTIKMLERQQVQRHKEACDDAWDMVGPELEWFKHPIYDDLVKVAKGRGLLCG